MIRIIRDPGTLQLTGIRASNPHSASALWSDLSSRRSLIAADVSLGAWRSHQIASEISAQLGLPEPAEQLTPAGAGRPPLVPSTSRIGRWIDMETAGNRAVLEAYQLAAATFHAVADREPLTFFVMTGANGYSWEPGDAFFVRFLAQTLSATGHRLVLAYCGPGCPTLPSGWCPTWTEVQSSTGAADSEDAPPLVALVPGIVTSEMAETLPPSADDRLLIPLPGRCFLVPPALRGRLHDVPPPRYDELAIAGRRIPWVAAYAAFKGTDGGMAQSFLWEYVRRVFEAGSFGIVLRLLERAIPLARSHTERAVFQVLSQSALIASERFAEAAALPPPDDTIPAEVRGWLWHTKGWGLTRAGRPAEAERCLERARALLGKNRDGDEYLYVVNISALNQLKLGNWDGALSMERQIRHSLERISAGSFQIAYINSLNLARLYMRRGEHDAAERYYREAFATSLGAWSDSDAIYWNVCMARLHEARQDYVEALNAWARAALYWISAPVPEAVAKRVIAAILDPAPPGLEGTAGSLFDDVSAALTVRLLASANQAGVELDHSSAQFTGSSPTATFVRPEGLEETACSGSWQVLPGAGTWFLGAPLAAAPARASVMSQRLRLALLALLAPPGTEEGGTWTIVVDDRLGNGLAGNESDLLSSCLRLGINTVPLVGCDTGRLVLDPLKCQLRARLCNAVARVEPDSTGEIVVFKRYYPSRRLSRAGGTVVHLLAEGDRSILDITAALVETTGASVVRLVRALERHHIVQVFLPSDLSFAQLARQAAP